MWVAKFRNWHKDCLIRPRCVRYNITDFVYLVNSWTEKNKFYYTEMHILQGRDEDQKKFIKDFRKDKSIVKFEQVGNHIITLNYKPAEHGFYSPVFDSRLIYIKPVCQRSDGYEDWEVASWDRDMLMSLRKIPTFEMKLLSIKDEKITDLFVPHIYPKLSLKQKEAIELAVNEGYYGYPRKIHLEELSKISKVRRQTYEENLRRAEKKLIPFLTENSA